jgi:hypothetical protein
MALRTSSLTNMGAPASCTPRFDDAEVGKVVGLLVRCHTARRALRETSVSLTAKGRAVSAEAQALTPRELEWLRAAKERTDPREWAQIKQRAKSQSLILPAPPAPRTPAPAPAAGPVASSAPTQQGGSGSSTAGGSGGARLRPEPTPEKARLRGEVAQLHEELAVVRAQLASAQAVPTAPPPQAAPSQGQLRSGACVEMLDKLEAEAGAIKQGVQQCLEKELGCSDGGDDLDLAAMHELEGYSARGALMLGDVQLLQHVVPEGLDALAADVRSMVDYVRTLQGEMKGRVFARRERRYRDVLACQHAVHEVPSDGNCLFWSVHVASELAARRRRRRPHGGSTDGGQDDDVEFVRRLLGGAEAAAAVRSLRARAAAHIGRHVERYEAQMVAAAIEALSSCGDGGGGAGAQLREALCEGMGVCCELMTDGSWDGTTRALADAASRVLVRAQAQAQAQAGVGAAAHEDAELSAATEQACDAYLRTAGTDGVFGERLEIQVLAELLGCRLSVFYYGGGSATPNAEATLCTPAEVFEGGATTATAGGAEAREELALLHHVSGNHFEPVMLSASSTDPPPHGSRRRRRADQATRPLRPLPCDLGDPATATAEASQEEAKVAASAGVSQPARRERRGGGGCSCGGRRRGNTVD